MPEIIAIDGNTYKAEFNQFFEVEIGDQANTSSFRPHVKMKRKNINAEIDFYYPGISGPVGFDSQNNKLVFNVDTNTALEFYPKEPDNQLTEGSIEVNLVLKKRPAGNKNTFTFKVETNDFTWKKIIGLDQEFDQAKCLETWGEKGEYVGPFTITPTEIVDQATGEIMKKRAPELVNSYRGRAKQNYHVTSDMGEIKRGPRKGQQLKYTRVSRTMAHFRRGKMIDADGSEAWVEDMNLDQVGNLTFTLPLEFLKTAKYPICQALGVDPAYTEAIDALDLDGYCSDGQWNDYDIETEHGLTDGMVAEIILENQQKGTENVIGVRTYGSSITRNVQLHECEPDGGGGGDTHCRMFTEVEDNSGTGYIEIYTEDVSDLAAYLVGYWENTGFTEMREGIGGISGSTWEEDIVSDGNNCVHHFACILGIEAARTFGVRINGSELERSILLHESEGGGDSIIDFIAKADSDGIVEFKTDTGAGDFFFDMGFFGEEMDFVELWQQITNDGDGDWDAEDLTAYLDEDGRVVDFILTHELHNDPATLGIRDGDDSSTARYLVEHEAEGANDDGTDHEFTGFGISVKTNASGIVNIYSNTAYEAFYLTGYFKSAGPTNTNINTSTDLSLNANLAYAATFERASSAGIDLAAAVVKSWGRTISTSAAISLSSALAYAAAYTRNISANLDLASALDRALAASRSSSANMTLLAGLSRAVAYARATSANITMSAALVFSQGVIITISAALSIAANLSRAFDSTRASSTGATLAAALSKSFGKMISISANISLSSALTRAFDSTRASSVGIALSSSLSKAIGYVRASTVNLSLSSALSRAVTYARSTSSNITLQSIVSRAVAYSRSISSGITLSVSLVATYAAGAVEHFFVSTTTYLSLAANVSRTVAYDRAISAGITLAASIRVQVRRLIRFIIKVISPWRVKTFVRPAMRIAVMTKGALKLETGIIAPMKLESAVQGPMTIRTSISRRG